MNDVTQIIVGDVKYVREDLIEATSSIEFTGEQSVASLLIGKKVIVRSRNEGINAGIVVVADNTGIMLKECRRLYYHKPLDKKTSWYEGVAKTGISRDSKVSCTVDSKSIIEDYSVTICSSTAMGTIMQAVPHEQS